MKNFQDFWLLHVTMKCYRLPLAILQGWWVVHMYEEADTRMFVHISGGAEHGMNKILPRTVDTDVVVIGIN